MAELLQPEASARVSADVALRAGGLWILPGGVDLHVHVSDGAESFEAGTRCAAAGGVTTILDMAPFHGCVRPEQFLEKVAQARASSVTDFGLVAGIVVNEEDLEALQELARLGAAYFKLFMPAEPPANARLLWSAVQAAARTGLRLAVHAEEAGCFSPEVDWTDPFGFARARPVVAEACAVAQVLEMARAAGAPVHICHVSSARAVELIASAKAQGVDLSSEVPAHFLLLDEGEFARLGPRVKTTPPLRKPEDRQALWAALNEGTLDAVASDHFLGSAKPASVDLSQMREAPAGIAGLELSLPLLLAKGVREGHLSLGRFVEISAQRPAAIAQMGSRKGQIAVGADADLVFFDPETEWTVSSQGSFSRAETTPFAGWRLRGRVRRTLVRGETVWDGETITAESGWGTYVPSRGGSG
ncbi:MAG: dihydroorotase family protein [Chloroflexi bacterium]|nr:dihydroorotase family protein [Chloroflexota bacterium]